MPSKRKRATGGREYRTVIPCKHVKKGRKSGGAFKLWAFSVADLGVLFDWNDDWVRRKIKSGALDPTDLESICRLWAKKNKVGKLPENSQRPGEEGVFPREFSSPSREEDHARTIFPDDLTRTPSRG